MPAKLLGAHMPTAGGLDKAIRNGKAIGCTAVQVFTSSPQQWRAKEVTDEMASKFKDALKETGITSVVSHDSYLVNLSALDTEMQAKSIAGLKGELNRCAAYGIPFAVSHIGAHMGRGIEEGLRIAAEGIAEVLADTPDSVTLLMETTAGQGSVLNSKFEELAWLLDALKGHKRLGVCLDTCHVFVAGYDLRNQEMFEATFDRFGKAVGLDRLKAIHCNDSKKGLGSHADRHEHIGKGEIGEEAFRLLVNDPKFEYVPILLETPEAETMHQVNLEVLMGLREA
ncbi:MAG: deoxyribonuclease IV [Armatimonadetes bacterium]|nr:deoxyribonuclease IV [Armatimonadota bacterium]